MITILRKLFMQFRKTKKVYFNGQFKTSIKKVDRMVVTDEVVYLFDNPPM